MNVTVFDRDLGAERLKAFQVKIDWPRTDDAAAGQRNGGFRKRPSSGPMMQIEPRILRMRS